MNKDKISIIIPFKNEAKYLQSCIESIQNQKNDEFEIEVILVDDHSTDSSSEIASVFSRQFVHFNYLKNKGDGVVDALQFGLEKSTGNYIHRMDADDLMAEDKLKNLYQLFAVYPNLNIATGKVKYFREDQALGEGFIKYEEWLNQLIDDSLFYQDIYKECTVASANWLMSKNDLLSIGGFGVSYPEDYDLVFRAYQAKFIVRGCSEVTHLWRDHSLRASRTVIHYKDNNFFKLKLRWFLKLDYDPSGELFVYGAGKKGKTIAKMLSEKEIPFRWFTNNNNKIGQNIYGVILENDTTIFDVKQAQILVLISNPKENEEVLFRLEHNSLIQGQDFFIFN